MSRKNEMIQVPHLEPKDLYDRRIRRDYARLRAYNTLLEQIYQRVYSTSQLSGNTSSVLYSVPPFILGLPKLDMEDCIVYLVWQLRQSGFEVRFTWPNMLFISWRHHEGAYLATQNPIVKAMTPAPQPAPLPKVVGGSQKKKSAAAAAVAAQQIQSRQPTVAFNDAVDLITSANPSTFGAPVQPGTRRATDYEPPASFIQNLERPGPGRDKAIAKGNVLADLWTI
jgi:hypothetical protein